MEFGAWAVAAMRLCPAKPQDFQQLSVWNRQLQEDEGATVMSLTAIEDRLRGWLNGQYEAVVFLAEVPVGYALYRPADPDAEGAGIYIRQFHIEKSLRRQGYGTQAFGLLAEKFSGQERIILEALESNPSGKAFWQSLGFHAYSTKYEHRGS